MRRVASIGLSATGAASLAVLALPEREGKPSARTVLRLLPSGLAGALLQPPLPREPSLELVQRDAVTQVNVQLCGVCHTEPASANAAQQCVARCAAASSGRGSVCAVALECDAETFSRIRAGARALRGLSPARVRAEGEGLVQQALFELPEVKTMAKRAGVELREPSQVPLPPVLARHLRHEGVLWGGELEAAAAQAEALGARVVFLDSPVRPGPRIGGLLGGLACWLRTQALQPGVDERSCARGHVDAANRATRELVPREYERHVAKPDEHMARRIRELCAEVRTGGDSGQDGVVVAVVGARHVPGLVDQLGEKSVGERENVENTQHLLIIHCHVFRRPAAVRCPPRRCVSSASGRGSASRYAWSRGGGGSRGGGAGARVTDLASAAAVTAA